MDDFYIGQRVECVYDGEWYCQKTSNIVSGPKKGDILTVFNIINAEPNEVEIEEWRLQLLFSLYEDSYAAICFRPLKKVETDISIFTEILNKAPSELVT